MSHSEDFSRAAQRCEDNGLAFEKANDACIVYKTAHDTIHTTKFYDFLARSVTTVVVVKSGNDTSHAEAFSDVDGETLSYMHSKLIDLGGNPPPLPAPDGQRSVLNKGPR